MLKKRAIRKLFITTLTAFILLTVYSIPNMNKSEEVLKTNLEVEYITGIGTNNIYLLDNNNYLVKTKILLDSSKIEEEIKLIIKNLTKSDNSKYPSGLNATIPENTKLINLNYDEGFVSLNFNKKMLNIEDELKDRMIESIVYSIMDLEKVKGIIITVDDEVVEDYEKVLDKNIGINKKYDISSRKNINKVVIYYLEEIYENKYYVPVTRYLNDSRDKVKIIVDELSSSYIYEPNLMSFLNSNTSLIDSKEEQNIMTLNFNNAIFDKDNKVIEEVKYSLAYSIFDNYDVNEVLIEVDGKNVENISKKDLP